MYQLLTGVAVAVMSKFRKMLQIFVASGNGGIFKDVHKLLANESVVHIEVGSSGQISADDKKAIEEKADILLSDVPIIIDVAYTAKKLKWAASTWAGVEPLIKQIDAEKPPPFPITRMGGAYSDIMAEYLLGHVIARERNILELSKEQEIQNWDRLKYSNYRPLKEVTIGLLGVGEIGKVAASKCAMLGMTVIGVTRTIPEESRKCPAVSQYRSLTELPYVLEKCDYTVNLLPSTPDTRGLLSGNILSHCKAKKSTFINIGRGDITDEETIVKAIGEGWIGGAVLDVFKEEPLPKTSPLWTLPGVSVTPHVGGVTLSQLIAEAFVENYKLFLNEKPLQFVLDFKRGY